MTALLGVLLFSAAAALFFVFLVIVPDRARAGGASDFGAQMACVLITALFTGGSAAFIDFVVKHDDTMGMLWFGLALAATIAVIGATIRLGRRVHAA